MLGFAAAAAMWPGSSVHRPSNRLPWLAVGLSQLLIGLGDVVYDHVTSRSPGRRTPSTSSARASSSSASPRSPCESARHGQALASTAAIIALPTLVGALAASGLRRDRRSQRRGLAPQCRSRYPRHRRAPAGAGRSAVARRLAGTPSYWLLAAAVADVVWSPTRTWVTQLANSTYYRRHGIARRSGWLGSYALLGAAALHPSMRRLTASSRTRTTGASALRHRR